MHTIDLLRGEGIPAKATFGTICLAGLIVAVPFLVGASFAGRYLQSREVIGINQEAITRAEQTVERYKADVAERDQKERQQAAINAKLTEVKACLGDYVQWSPVVETIVREMPAGMVMTRLAVETLQDRLTTTVKEGESSRPTNVTINKRVLVVELAGRPGGNYDNAVRDYGERLKTSAVLASRLEGVIPSQQGGELGDIKTTIHSMKLVFKPGT
jgi:Tfp pilus assembly protein PilN